MVKGSPLASLAFVLLAVSAAHAQAPGATLASNDFTASAEGWSISGDTDTMPGLFVATDGHPGGCISGTDQALGETWYFTAPQAVLRALPRAVNGTLSYWLRQSGSMISLNDDDVVIVGRAGRLSYRFPYAPGTTWTHFSVRLSAADSWTWNWNRPATQAQIDQVLAAPVRLEIRGEYVTGDDRGWLDSFVLAAAPAAANIP